MELTQNEFGTNNSYRLHEILVCPTCEQAYENIYMGRNRIKPTFYDDFPKIHLAKIDCPICVESMQKFIKQKADPKYMEGYYVLAINCNKKLANIISKNIERDYPGVARIVETAKKNNRNRRFRVEIKNSYWIDCQIEVLKKANKKKYLV